jgi:hypothetical protein
LNRREALAVIVGYEQARRYGQLIEKLTGDEEIVPPGLILEVDRPEWFVLGQTRAWSTGAISVAGAVGNFGRLQIQNPAVTKQGIPALIVVVTGVKAVSVVSANTAFDVSTDDARILAGIAQNNALDTRVSARAAGVRAVGSQNAVDNSLPATGGNSIDRFVVNAVGGDGISEVVQRLAVVLKPNSNLSLTQRLANTALQGVMWGYERIARPEELEDA